jgi:hypothetical protein
MVQLVNLLVRGVSAPLVRGSQDLNSLDANNGNKNAGISAGINEIGEFTELCRKSLQISALLDQ